MHTFVDGLVYAFETAIGAYVIEREVVILGGQSRTLAPGPVSVS